MNWMTIEIMLGLLAVATLIGLAFKFLQGRGHSVLGHERIDLKKLRGVHNGKPATKLGARATAVLFSTSYCAICPSVIRQLAELEANDPSMRHVVVDITDRLDLAAHFGIMQTPTLLLTDADGEIRFRVSGAPKPGVLIRELNQLGVSTK